LILRTTAVVVATPPGHRDFGGLLFNARVGRGGRFRFRGLEEKMLHHGTFYDHGRLGAEIAYTIAKSLFPNKDFVLPEISKGGRDLFSTDDAVSVRARLIYDFSQFRPAEPEEVLELQLGSMLRKLAQDYAYNPKMPIGVASLSYFTCQKQLQAVVSFRRKQRNDSELDSVASGQTIHRAWPSARK